MGGHRCRRCSSCCRIYSCCTGYSERSSDSGRSRYRLRRIIRRGFRRLGLQWAKCQHALLAEGIGGLFGGVAYLATLDPVVDGMGALSFLPGLGVASVGGLLQTGVLLSHLETQQSSTSQTTNQTTSNSADSQTLKLLRANSSAAYSENLGPNLDYRGSHVAAAFIKRNPLTSNLNWNWQSYEHTLWSDWVNSTNTVSSDSLLQYEMNTAYMLADWERIGARNGWE